MPKKILGMSMFITDFFLKIYPYDPTSKFQESEIGCEQTFMKSKTNICTGQMFRNLRKCEILRTLKVAQNPSYKFFKMFCSKRESTVKFSS